MNKKILKILSYILIIIGVLKTILCAIVMFIGTIVLVNKDYILSLDIYKNSLEYHKAIKELTDFDISEIELFDFFVDLLFFIAFVILLQAIGNFIYGKFGIYASKGKKINQARVVGTAALVIGICELIDTVFTHMGSITVYDIIYIAFSILFLYCVNGIKYEREIKND